MTPCQKIRREILQRAIAGGDLSHSGDITESNVDGLYDLLVEGDIHWDYESEMRGGEVETELPCNSSRHCESKSVASRMSDGSWVGWTYWYGGGKHGEPGAIEWMEYAYDLACEETQEVVTVRRFTKVGVGE